MQWEHQVRPSVLLGGVAVTFAEKVLRAVQNAVSVYQAVRSEYATGSPASAISATTCDSLLLYGGDVVTVRSGCVRLARMATMVYEGYLEGAFLVSRWTVAGWG